MDTTKLILSVLALSGSFGAVAVFFKRGQGEATIKQLQTNIQAYKDAERLKDQRIAYLEGQVYSKDETIKKLSESK